MIELFIEGQRADISQDDSALLTYQLDDIAQFGSRNTAFSKTINLPGTARNNKLFGHIYDLKNSNAYDSTLDNIGYNFNASKSADCLVFKDNIQCFKGVLRLSRILIDKGIYEYQTFVLGDLGGFIYRLTNKKIQELDFSAYDHAYSVTNIVNSWELINGQGYYYPLIDYGRVSDDKINYDIQAFRPALYVREYLDKIITGAGYGYNAPLFDTARFRGFIIPNNRQQLVATTNIVLDTSRTSSAHILDSGSLSNVALQMQSVTGSLFTASNSNTKFTYNAAPELNGNITVSLFGQYVASTVSYTLVVKRNGVDISGSAKMIPITGNTFSQYYSWAVTVPVTLNTNDYIEVFFSSSASIFSSDYIVATGGVSIASLSTVEAPIELGGTIQMNDVIPKNILQKDFFVSIIKLCNLYVYEDSDRKNYLNISPFPDFYSTASQNSDNWTAKLDRESMIEVTPMSQQTARVYKFKYKQDNDHFNETYRKKYNESYGDYTYDSEFEFAKEEESVEIIFSPTPLVGYTGRDKVVSTILKLSNDGAIEDRVESNIRILQAKKIEGVASWNITNGGSTLTSLDYYGYGGHLNDPDAPSNDLNFGVPAEMFFDLSFGDLSTNQFNVYWSAYMAEITDKDSKLLSAKFYLTLKDIYELDFSKYKYVDGKLFRLNKIEDFNASYPELTRVELLTVQNTSYTDIAPSLPTEDDLLLVYTIQPGDSASILFRALRGKTVLLVARQDKFLIPSGGVNDPGVLYSFVSPTGRLILGNTPTPGEVLQILYKN